MQRVVVCRHGIVINRLFLEPLARRLRRHGFIVHNRTYPSTRKRIEEHARDLSDELTRIHAEFSAVAEPFELHAVTHSMGGLILRYALAHFPMPPLRRAVMIAPPNQGSVTARYFRNFPPYRWVFGRLAGAQLAADIPGIYGECGVPSNVEIGIIAGTSNIKLYPVPLPRPHDGIVSVEEARLAGFPVKELPYNHTLMLFREAIAEEAAHFLEHGRFRP